METANYDMFRDYQQLKQICVSKGLLGTDIQANKTFTYMKKDFLSSSFFNAIFLRKVAICRNSVLKEIQSVKT